jgi:hypothetical protein
MHWDKNAAASLFNRFLFHFFSIFIDFLHLYFWKVIIWFSAGWRTPRISRTVRILRTSAFSLQSCLFSILHQLKAVQRLNLLFIYHFVCKSVRTLRFYGWFLWSIWKAVTIWCNFYWILRFELFLNFEHILILLEERVKFSWIKNVLTESKTRIFSFNLLA